MRRAGQAATNTKTSVVKTDGGAGRRRLGPRRAMALPSGDASEQARDEAATRGAHAPRAHAPREVAPREARGPARATEVISRTGGLFSIAGHRRLLAVLAVAIFFTNLSNYTERFGLIGLVWIAVYAGLCVPVIVHGLVAGSVSLRPLVWWSGLYVMVSVLWFYRSPQDAFAYDELRLRVLSAMFLVLSLIAFADGAAQRVGQIAIAAATVIGVGVNVYELFHPQTFSTVVGRSAGLHGDSNQSAGALVLGLILGHGVVPGWARIPFVMATAVGIIPTFSRSGILAWLLVVAFFMLRTRLSMARLRRVGLLAMVVVGVLVSPLWSNLERDLYERGALNADVLNRISFFSGGAKRDASAVERDAVAAKAWDLVGEQPLLGHGTGAALRLPGFEVGTHNMYLSMMVDHGLLLGLAVLPLMLLATLWGANRRTIDLTVPLGAFVAMWCFFSHTVLEDRYVLLTVGLMASVVALNREPKTARVSRTPYMGSAQSMLEGSAQRRLAAGGSWGA